LFADDVLSSWRRSPALERLRRFQTSSQGLDQACLLECAVLGLSFQEALAVFCAAVAVLPVHTTPQECIDAGLREFVLEFREPLAHLCFC
jgi:hypothetical protein